MPEVMPSFTRISKDQYNSRVTGIKGKKIRYYLLKEHLSYKSQCFIVTLETCYIYASMVHDI